MIYVLRCKIGLEECLEFPIVQFVENVLHLLVPDFTLEIVPKEKMPDKHGETFPTRKLIRIREDVYLGAVRGNGRDRLTIAHEIAHLFLHADSISLCRLEPGQELKPYEDPEWQANAFAGELLAPSYLIMELSPYEVHMRFHVSMDAAKVQLRTLQTHPIASHRH